MAPAATSGPATLIAVTTLSTVRGSVPMVKNPGRADCLGGFTGFFLRAVRPNATGAPLSGRRPAISGQRRGVRVACAFGSPGGPTLGGDDLSGREGACAGGRAGGG